MEEASYTATDIEVLEGLEPVRKRPGMYIGGTEGPAGLHHLVKEILDNAVDEAMNGHADQIIITLHSDSESISIEDNGRGIPVDVHPKFKKSALELILTTLHAGGKFSARNYASAGGLHGVGASVVNALSAELIATISRDGFEWHQSFSQGKATTPIKRGGKTKNTGTRIFFRPDPEIFAVTEFSPQKVEKIIQEKAFLNKGLKIVFINECESSGGVNSSGINSNGINSGTPLKKIFCYEDGIRSYLTTILQEKELTSFLPETFFLEKTNGIKVECAFCWTESTAELVLSYVNGIFTSSGGTHEDGFKSGLNKALRNYFSVQDNIPKGIKITGEDIREGLVAVLSVTVPGSVSQLQFQGQTKDKLNNREIEAPVDALLKGFDSVLISKPSVAALVCGRIFLAAKARAAARSASQGVSRKIGISHRLNLPGKLADCSSTSPEKSETLIVEGDSAGGSAKQGRDRMTQAVLPLRGKILNSVAASDDKLKDNQEISDLIAALGCGSGQNIKVDKLRYDKIIILTDADADGMHISSLLMAFFFRQMKPLVQAGHLYIGLAPLFRVRIGSGSKEDDYWVYTEEEREKIISTHGIGRKVHVTRFKGLGEMNPKTLWETTLNPKTRNLLRIRIEDDEESTKMFERLLGKDSLERYKLIRDNAHRLEVDL